MSNTENNKNTIDYSKYFHNAVLGFEYGFGLFLMGCATYIIGSYVGKVAVTNNNSLIGDVFANNNISQDTKVALLEALVRVGGK